MIYGQYTSVPVKSWKFFYTQPSRLHVNLTLRKKGVNHLLWIAFPAILPDFILQISWNLRFEFESSDTSNARRLISFVSRNFAWITRERTWPEGARKEEDGKKRRANWSLQGSNFPSCARTPKMLEARKLGSTRSKSQCLVVFQS